MKKVGFPICWKLEILIIKLGAEPIKHFFILNLIYVVKKSFKKEKPDFLKTKHHTSDCALGFFVEPNDSLIDPCRPTLGMCINSGITVLQVNPWRSCKIQTCRMKTVLLKMTSE